MKKISLVIFILSLSVYSTMAQQTLHACCDDTICTPGTPVTLTATVDSGSTGSLLSIADDTYSQVIDLGFSFTFFGNTYTQCLLSTNNYISFEIQNALQYSYWPIMAAIPDPNYAIDG